MRARSAPPFPAGYRCYFNLRKETVPLEFFMCCYLLLTSSPSWNNGTTISESFSLLSFTLPNKLFTKLFLWQIIFPKDIVFIGGRDRNKFIAMLDHQTGNVFVLISSMGVQHCNAFIQVQKVQQTTRETDIKLQKSCGWPDRKTYGKKGILYCRSGDLNSWPASTCTAQNYRPRKWALITNLKPFSKPKFRYNSRIKNININI